MRHIQIKLTPNQQKICEKLCVDMLGRDEDENIVVIEKASYKGLIKLTTKHDILYFEEDKTDPVADAILTSKIRGCKALATKIRKLK